MTDIRKAAEPPLRPCPFCGGRAEFERTGTPRQSCIVVCTDCGARHESSDEGERSGWSWNRGVRLAAEQPQRIACVCGEPWRLGTVHRAGGPCYVAEQPQPEAPSGWRMVREDVVRFLNGEGPLEGFWWGAEGRPEGERGAYWWRKHLIAAPPPPAEPTYGSIAERAAAGLAAGRWGAVQPPAAEPSEAQVEAAWRAIPASHEDSRVSVITKGDVWVMLRAAAAARNSK